MPLGLCRCKLSKKRLEVKYWLFSMLRGLLNSHHLFFTFTAVDLESLRNDHTKCAMRLKQTPSNIREFIKGYINRGHPKPTPKFKSNKSQIWLALRRCVHGRFDPLLDLATRYRASMNNASSIYEACYNWHLMCWANVFSLQPKNEEIKATSWTRWIHSNVEWSNRRCCTLTQPIITCISVSAWLYDHCWGCYYTFIIMVHWIII